MNFTVTVKYDAKTGQLTVVPSATMRQWLDSNSKHITQVRVVNTNDKLFGGDTYK